MKTAPQARRRSADDPFLKPSMALKIGHMRMMVALDQQGSISAAAATLNTLLSRRGGDADQR